MCGRFTQRYTWDEIRTFLSVFGSPRNLQPHYNIAPTTTVDVVRPPETMGTATKVWHRSRCSKAARGAL